MRTIGLSGFAGVGKTEAARYIEKKYGFERRHIAEPLRAMLASLMAANDITQEDIDRMLTGDLKDDYIIPEFGCTSRHLQITLGTEWGRYCVSPDLWVDTWHRGIKPGQKAMNDSVRFPNEEEAIHRDDGITILIRRKGAGPAAFKWGAFGKLLYRATGLLWGVHDSERTDRLNPTVTIDNDGTIEDLHRSIDEAMHDYAGIVILSATNDNVPDAWLPVMERWGWTAEELLAADPSDVDHLVDLANDISDRDARDAEWSGVKQRWGFTSEELVEADPTDASTLVDLDKIYSARELAAAQMSKIAAAGGIGFATFGR